MAEISGDHQCSGMMTSCSVLASYTGELSWQTTRIEIYSHQFHILPLSNMSRVTLSVVIIAIFPTLTSFCCSSGVRAVIFQSEGWESICSFSGPHIDSSLASLNQTLLLMRRYICQSIYRSI